MPLKVEVTITPVGDPIFEDDAALQALAGAGAFGPAGTSMVAITTPKIFSDLGDLRFRKRPGPNGVEFIFDTGMLKLNLRQQIHILDGLGPCARTVWLQHEQKHVRDNQALMARMEPELRKDQEFIDLLVNPTEGHPVADFKKVEDNLQAIVGDVFERLTTEAAARQDTVQEYRSVERQLRLRCGHALRRVLRRGHYGDGIDLVQIALNAHPPSRFPSLKIDGIFGSNTERRVNEFQHDQHLSEDGVVGPETRAALGLDWDVVRWAQSAAMQAASWLKSK
ncbi:MAG TPA: peptidoglycan-binding domain-containing protein [Bryobacteraceae bacterium]|jgi:peptidoglycan hydrolase-like protein with peptidoglycan-binding domain